MTRLRHTLRSDLPAIVDVWVDAFAADPYFRWITPDDADWPAFGTAWLTFIVELTFERGYTFIGEPADVAIAWIPPDLALVGPDDLARGRAIIAAHAGDARADDAFTTIMAARAHALEESHWTLQYVGVRPSRQGAGLGEVATRPVLDVCDADGLPCGLVSTNPRNVTFYRRLGFDSNVEVPTPDGAATLRPMRRTPR